MPGPAPVERGLSGVVVWGGRLGDDGWVVFRILGPLEVVAGGRVVRLGAAKPRAVLAILLLHANEPVLRDRLIEELWAGRPPSSAAKTLQTYVFQLRRALGREVIRTVSAAYELRVDAGSFDLLRFEQLVGCARAVGPAAANGMLREALALWRGEFLAEFADASWAQSEIARLEELRVGALQLRIETDLALGGGAELVPELELLVGQHPHREGLRAQLMLALYRSGRQADALAAYRDARRSLVEALGIEPTLALRRLERSILDQDPALDLVTVGPPGDGAAQPEPVRESRWSSFVGRSRELREIRALLGREEVRLLTLTGAAGAGKTRLALEVTGVSGASDPDAVLVELGRIADAVLVARAIANELGVKERPGHSAREALVEYLRERQALLLLDNFEHVLDAASLLRELLAGAPGVRLLVTSRAPLGVPEERVFPVSALALPDRSQPRSLAELGGIEAVRLFVDRAQAARPDFELTETNAESVSELCVRLDGLPLALELAAARCNLLSPQALLERLGSRLDLLRATPGSGFAERQWTLRGAIEWSYDLLQPEQQQLFTSLAVFVGGFTLAAAEHVAAQPHLDILEGIETLHRNSLLTAEHAAGDEPRLGMLETIREFALERLGARGDGEVVRRRHAAFYLVLAEEAEPGLLGPQQREWLERLDSERDNIRAALTSTLQTGEAEVGLRIGAALWRYSQLRNHEQELRERLQELLALGFGSPATRAKAQTMLASLALNQGDRETALRMLEESLSVHRREGDAGMVANALGLLGWAALHAGETDSALALTLEAHEVARGGASPYIESASLWQVGVCLAVRGEFDDAERKIEEAVDLARKLGNARSVGGSKKSLAGIALLRGNHAQAGRLFEESLDIHRSLGDAQGVSHSLSHLAFLALEAGDLERSRDLVSEALAIERERGPDPWVANALEISARLAATDGEPTLALRLYAHAALLREIVGIRLHYELGWPDPTSHVRDLRGLVGEEPFEEEWARGRAMSLSDSIDQAIGEQRMPEPITP
jgi:predicted ATPase/DNA-binding SARP family transcriptional activator